MLAATALAGLLEGFYVPFRVGAVRIPISVAIAVIVHPLLTWLIRTWTGSSRAMIAPLAVWLAVVLPLGMKRADGDLIITDNWVSTSLLFGGSLLFVGAIGILLPARGQPSGGAGR